MTSKINSEMTDLRQGIFYGYLNIFLLVSQKYYTRNGLLCCNQSSFYSSNFSNLFKLFLFRNPKFPVLSSSSYNFFLLSWEFELGTLNYIIWARSLLELHYILMKETVSSSYDFLRKITIIMHHCIIWLMRAWNISHCFA